MSRIQNVKETEEYVNNKIFKANSSMAQIEFNEFKIFVGQPTYDIHLDSFRCINMNRLGYISFPFGDIPYFSPKEINLLNQVSEYLIDNVDYE